MSSMINQKNRLLIATHNSVTGERGDGLLSLLVTPFSVCQSKSLKEQYDAGCRYFDIRTYRDKKGAWRCGHGLWTAKRSFSDVMNELKSKMSDAYFSVTIERGGEEEYNAFKSDHAADIEACSNSCRLTYIAVKHPRWMVMDRYAADTYVEAAYKILDGSSWHTYIPIPWLWEKVYCDHPRFNSEHFVMVDFL